MQCTLQKKNKMDYFVSLKIQMFPISVEYTASSHMNLLRENTYMYKADLSTESKNILNILELGLIFWMNLVS